MTNNQVRADRRASSTIAEQLAALGKMTVGELADKYREIFGIPTRVRLGRDRGGHPGRIFFASENLNDIEGAALANRNFRMSAFAAALATDPTVRLSLKRFAVCPH